MIVVSNTTPLSELAKIGQLDLLHRVFGQIVVPQEVYDEITTGTHPAAALVPLATWIEILPVTDTAALLKLQVESELDRGETAAILLAQELGADRLLLDDLDGRREAIARNLPVTGTLGILLTAKQRGLISSVRPLIDALMAQGKRISQQLYAEVLAIASESD